MGKGFFSFMKQCAQGDWREWVPIILLSGFCFLFYFLSLDRWELRKADEIREAQVAREMVEGGDWVSLKLYGRPYVEKPPLFYWLMALSSYLWRGVTSFSARFPSALFGTFTVLVTFLIGKNLFDSRTGLFSGLILATSFLFARYSTRVYIDATLTFFTTASLFCFLRWYQRGDEKKKARKLFLYGFYISVGLATLSKGAPGFILPLVVVIVYLAVLKDWKGIKGMKILPGMLLILVIVLSWYLPAVLKGGQGYLEQTLIHRTIGYYLGGSWHSKPFYFYLRNFPADFLPWILFLPGAIVYGYSKEASGKKKEFLYLLLWFIVMFIFFSCSKTKRDLYLLPLYPAASLMIGRLWGDMSLSRVKHFPRGWISLPLGGFVASACVVGATILWLVCKRFPSYWFFTLLIACFLIGGCLALFLLYRSQKYSAVFLLLVGIAGVMFFYTENFLLYWDHRFASAFFVIQEIKKEIGLFSP